MILYHWSYLPSLVLYHSCSLDLFATSCCIWKLRMHLENFWIIYLIHVYRNTVVVNVGTDIIDSIAAYLIGRALILVIICVKTVTIDIIVFICFATIDLTSQWQIIFSVRVSSAILTISLGEIKQKMSILPMNVLHTVKMHEGSLLNQLIFDKFVNTMKLHKMSRFRPKYVAFNFLILKKVWLKAYLTFNVHIFDWTSLKKNEGKSSIIQNILFEYKWLFYICTYF